MRRSTLIAAILLVCLQGLRPTRAGEDAGPPPIKHTSPDPMKCTACRAAYDKAMAYVQSKLRRSTFPVKMVAGWLFLADRRFKEDLDHCVDSAVNWRKQRGYRENSHPGNWYPALAASWA